MHVDIPLTGATVTAASSSNGTCTHTSTAASCNLPSLTSGGSGTIQVSATSGNAGTASATATASFGGVDPVSANNSASADTVVRVTGDIGVDITDSVDPATTGAAFSYAVTVRNAGPNAGSVHLSVPVTGATVSSASMPGATCTNTTTTVTCDLASLVKDGLATLTIGVSASAACSASATATATFSGTDTSAANDSATASTTVVNPPAPPSSGGGISGGGGGGGGSFDWLWLALLGALCGWRIRPRRFRAAFGAVLASACLATAHAGVNSWTVTGPDGGFVTAVAICPTQPDTMLAQTLGGLYRSTDGGAHWTAQGNAIGTNTAIVFDPSDTAGSRVYLASLKLYRSDDGGRTFGTFDTPVNYGITNMAVAPDGTLYISDQSSHLFRSSDHGLTWSTLPIAWPETLGSISFTLATDPNDANRLYVALPSRGVYRSDDRGQTWITPVAGSPGTATSTSTTINFIAVQPGDSNRLLLAGDWAHYTSVDRGASWSASYTTSMQRWVGFDPAAPAKAVSISVDGRVSRSLDGGLTWPAQSMGANLQVWSAVSAGFAASTPGRLLLATSDGPFLSDDGGVTFAQRTAGLHASTVGAFAAADDGTVYAAFESGPSGVFRQDTGGWSPLANGALRTTFGAPTRLTRLATAATNRNLLFTVTNNMYLAHSFDGGASWLGPAADISVNAGLQDVAVDPSNPSIAYVATYNQGLWRTTDGGDTWHPRTTGLPDRIDAIGIDPANTQILYVLSTNPPHGIYKSIDGGLTWNPCADVALGTRLGFTFDPVDSQTVYVYSGGDVLKTTNGGTSWTQLDFGPPHGVNQRAMSVMVDPLLRDTLFVVGPEGMPGFLRSVDGGASWESVRLEVPQGEFLFLDRAILDPLRPNLLHVGVTGLGIVDYEVAPDLSISIDGLTSPIAADSTITGLVTVRNRGPLAASAADVRITLPDWAQVTVPQRCTKTGSSLDCSLPALRVGQPFSVPLQLAIGQGPAQGQITASVAGHETDAVPDNNDASLSLASATQAKIGLAFEIDATTVAHNTNVLLTTRVSNPGPSRARDVRVELDLGTLAATDVLTLPNTCVRDGAKLNCQFGTLEAASSVSFGVHADVTAIGANTVSGTATRAGTDADAVVSNSLLLQAKPVADLSLALLDSPDPARPGAALTYTATVQNSGPDPGTSAVALQFVGVTVGSATTSAGTCAVSGSAVNCDLSSLASGASATISVATTAGAAGVATASGKVTFAGQDASAANDSGAESTTITAPASSGGSSSNGGGGGGGGSLDWLLLGWLGAALTFQLRRTFRGCAA